MRGTTVVIGHALAALLLASTALAGGGTAGANAAAYLGDAAGARPVGMGGAFVAVADDANAVYYNPGALPLIGGLAFQGSYALASLDRAPYQGTAVWNAPAFGVFGLGVTGLQISEIDGRDPTGEPTDSFSSSEMAIAGAYGTRIGPWLGVGGAAKYLYQSLADNKGTGIAFDLGAHAHFDPGLLVADRVAVGVAVSNIGGTLEWDTDSSHKDDVAPTARYGVAVAALPSGATRIVAALDGVKTGESDLAVHAGAEFWFRELFALRAGLSDEDATYGLSALVGMVRVDYAYAPDELDEGATHWLSLHVNM